VSLLLQTAACQQEPATEGDLSALENLSGDSQDNTLSTTPSYVEQAFTPSVSATCRAGVMTVKVETPGTKFQGVVHARDYRRPACTSYGLRTSITLLNINMLTAESSDDYCGVFMNEKSDERSVAVTVRMHKTLELADDKFYMITCGRAGFQNTNNDTSLVTLQLLREGRKVQQVVYGRDYSLKAHISQPDGSFGMLVKRCFSFSDQNSTVELVDERGCPDPSIMSEFSYSRLTGTAEATLFSMFKFPDSNRVNFQCDIVICKGDCDQPDCQFSSSSSPVPQAR
jgi:predicted nucleic-acid-binding Zn-ribbon protein